MNYYIIGEREIVLAFGLAGIKGQAVVTKDEALKAFNHATGQDKLSVSETVQSSVPVETERIKVLILTEDVSLLLEDEILKWQMGGKFPLIVEIPCLQGNIEGKKTLTDSIREAIGIQV